MQVRPSELTDPDVIAALLTPVDAGQDALAPALHSTLWPGKFATAI